MSDVMELFDDFSRRYRRGEQPDVGDYLDRAADGQEELSRLLDRFLTGAPPPDPDVETVAAMSAWLAGEPPLLELRRGRGLKRDAVVDELVDSLELDPGKRGKVKRYFHELEAGTLDPSGVSARVWDVLERVLGPKARTLAALRAAPLTAEPAFRAMQPSATPFEPADRSVVPREGTDEIDKLFTATP